jgi:hypothetical protein
VAVARQVRSDLAAVGRPPEYVRCAPSALNARACRPCASVRTRPPAPRTAIERPSGDQLGRTVYCGSVRRKVLP